jgi:hypothetical protein
VPSYLQAHKQEREIHRAKSMVTSLSRARSRSAIIATLAALLGASTQPASAQSIPTGATSVKERNIGITRSRAASMPRSESDQAIVDGWPLYRTERGQQAFNDAMATLKATNLNAPPVTAFKNCANLDCPLTLPTMTQDGWVQAGRIWVSASEYVLFVHSPRQRGNQNYRRRPANAMRYFVFHEFHNSSRNTDAFDTISSHSGAVFVPFYMSKPAVDAHGRRFVMIVQTAPYDVASIHATNYGSAGAGIEVARNVMDTVEPLQNLAGILIATITKTRSPNLRVVNHRGAEGQPMLAAYDRRLSAIQSRRANNAVILPFIAAAPQRMLVSAASIDDVITRRGMSPRLPIAERGFVPTRTAAAPPSEPRLIAPIRLAERTAREPERQQPEPQLIEPIRQVVPRRTLNH